MTDRPDADAAGPVQVFPIAIGDYLHHANLPVDGEVERIGELLADFGGYLDRWTVPEDERGRDAIDDRLREWTEPVEPHDTVLYWVGHGESTGDKAALAHRRSPTSYVEDSGVAPDVLASAILRRQGTAGDGDPWVLVIVDACQSARFVRLLVAELLRDLQEVRRVLLVGTSGAGRAWLGRFSSALETCLRHTYRANREIVLWDLAGQLQRMVPGCVVVPLQVADVALIRRAPVVAGMSVPLDVLAEVEAVLANLTEDERRHFVPKAQGAEAGEVTWYFEGRARERRFIVDWLRTERPGMLVVTGVAGSGKSALLGHVLVHSRPRLRELLVHHGLVDPLPVSELPPDNVFDATIHLTGMTTLDVVLAICAAVQMWPHPEAASITDFVNELIVVLMARRRPPTLLLDALDEAQDPLAVASVLSRLAGAGDVRLVVGTRRSTMEGPDLPEPADDDLLRALRPQDEVLVVSRDPEAVARYVWRRLTKGVPAATTDQIAEAARMIAVQQREFLFARLAVHELIARSHQLIQLDLDWLLGADHRTVFDLAVGRLFYRRASHTPLLRALALARGRGLPIKDGVWGRVAGALTGEGSPLGDDDVAALLADAAPYVLLDAEDGQSVYRLAHRTFQEVLRPSPEDHYKVAAALVAEAAEHDRPLNPYVVRHLTGHVGEAGPAAWESLAAQPSVLDRLDPQTVAADTLRTAFGRMRLPAEIAGVLAAHHLLREAAAEDRRGLREIAMARHANTTHFPRAGEAWSVRLALLRQHPVHLTMTGHTGPVHTAVTYPARDERQLLATGGEDRTVRIWDPTVGTQLGDPLPAPAPVTCLVTLTDGSGRVLLAGACPPRVIRLWNPETGGMVRDLLTHHIGPLTALAAVRHGDDRWVLATGTADGVVRLWNPATGELVGQPLTGNGRAVTALTTFTDGTGHHLLAGAVKDGTVFVWDPGTGARQHKIDGGRKGRVSGLAALTAKNGHTMLVTSRWDHTVRVHELRERWGPLRFIAPARPLTSVAAFPGDHGWRIAAGSSDGVVWLWDEGRTGQRLLTGHNSAVNTMTTMLDSDGHLLLVTGSQDGAVRVWDSDSSVASGDPVPLPVFPTGILPFAGIAGRASLIVGGTDTSVMLGITNPQNHEQVSLRWQMSAMVTFRDDHNRWRLLFTRGDGTVWLWDPDMGLVRTRVNNVGNNVAQMVVFRAGDGRLRLATVGGDRLLQTWDLNTGEHADFAHTGHTARTTTITTFSDGDRTLLAAGDEDSTIRVWDPHTGAQRWHLALNRRPVNTLVAIPGDRPLLAATTRDDKTLWIWDPHEDSVAALFGHSGWIPATTTMSRADQTLLVSGDDTGTLKIWNPRTTPGDALIRTIRTGIPVRGLAPVDGGLAIVSEEGLLLLSL